MQAKYKCSKCKNIVEKKEHCKRKTKLVSGYNWINNNMVNIFSSVITTVISLVVICFL